MGKQDAFQESNLTAFNYNDPRIWGDPHHRRAIMASLVEGVYRMEKCRNKWPWKDAKHEKIETMPQLWTTFRYETLELIEDGDHVIGAVYHSLLDCQNHPAPQIVVALRGTVHSKRDLEANFAICFHQLSAHKRFHIALDKTRDLMDRFGPRSVCLTGHSKGAALALLVGRKLAEEGCYLEAHLFNPPNPSVATKPLGLSSEVMLAVGVAHNVAANTLACLLQPKSTRNHDRDAFLSVCKWMPNLYINELDLICSSYIDYFKLNEQLPKLKKEWFGRAISSTPQSMRDILRSGDCRPVHLIPSAYLFIKQEASLNKLLSAHRLVQWLNLDLEILPLRFER